MYLSEDYRAAQSQLLAQGYTARPQSKGIFPYLFSKEDKTLYLFRPQIDGRFRYQVQILADDELRPANFHTNPPTLLIPASQAGDRYVWLPRRMADAPALLLRGHLLSKQDVSELCGLSLATVQQALKHRERPLVPVSERGRTLLFAESTVLQWMEQRETHGRHVVPPLDESVAQRSYCTNTLKRRLRRALRQGQIDTEALAAALNCPGCNSDQLVEMAGTLRRKQLIALMADQRIQRKVT